MSAPLFSIVVPVYNAERYLKETLESLLAQSCKDFEIIAVNDGSTDQSRTILHRYEGQVQVIDQVNKGQAEALNLGWTKAKGPWIGYLSADDRLKPNALQTMRLWIEENPTSIAFYPDYDLIDENSRKLKTVRAPEFNYERVVSELVCPPGPGLVFRRDLFLKHGGWRSDLKQIPDFEYWLRLGAYGKFVHVAQNLAEFRVHSDSTTFAPSPFDRAEEPVRVMMDFFSHPELTKVTPKLSAKSLSFAHGLSARLHIRSSRYRIGLIHLTRAISHWPWFIFHPRAIKLIANAWLGRVAHRLRQVFAY